MNLAAMQIKEFAAEGSKRWKSVFPTNVSMAQSNLMENLNVSNIFLEIRHLTKEHICKL